MTRMIPWVQHTLAAVTFSWTWWSCGCSWLIWDRSCRWLCWFELDSSRWWEAHQETVTLCWNNAHDKQATNKNAIIWVMMLQCVVVLKCFLYNSPVNLCQLVCICVWFQIWNQVKKDRRGKCVEKQKRKKGNPQHSMLSRVAESTTSFTNARYSYDVGRVQV